jgi:uncharacterized protein (TIGR00296 family)
VRSIILVEKTMYSGEYLVKLARNTIETYLSKGIKIAPPKDAPEDLWDESGVFVTLNRFKRGLDPSLRGCIGRIISTGSTLIESTIDSAIDAATRDPRFPTVELSEMSTIIIEVTVLTVPEKLVVEDSNDYFDLIKIGRHGLIAERGRYNRGLLLPQVPVEHKWSIKEYLDYVCRKAGLPKESWMDLQTTILSFEGFIFSETAPKGNIQQRTIQ